MLRHLLLLLLICLAVGPASSMTKFEFSGQLFCNLEFFRYHMTFWELDSTSPNDPISHNPEVYSHYPHFYKAKAEDDHDGGLGNNHFEIVLRMVHSCITDGSDGKYRKLEVDFGRHPINDRLNHIYKDINVTNAGEPTIDVIGKFWN